MIDDSFFTDREFGELRVRYRDRSLAYGMITRHLCPNHIDPIQSLPRRIIYPSTCFVSDPVGDIVVTERLYSLAKRGLYKIILRFRVRGRPTLSNKRRENRWYVISTLHWSECTMSV